LRQIRTDSEALRENMREVKTRLGHMEDQIIGLHAPIARLHAQIASLST